jgi:hypothetical protein
MKSCDKLVFSVQPCMRSSSHRPTAHEVAIALTPTCTLHAVHFTLPAPHCHTDTTPPSHWAASALLISAGHLDVCVCVCVCARALYACGVCALKHTEDRRLPWPTERDICMAGKLESDHLFAGPPGKMNANVGVFACKNICLRIYNGQDATNEVKAVWIVYAQGTTVRRRVSA